MKGINFKVSQFCWISVVFSRVLVRIIYLCKILGLYDYYEGDKIFYLGLGRAARTLQIYIYVENCYG